VVPGELDVAALLPSNASCRDHEGVFPQCRGYTDPPPPPPTHTHTHAHKHTDRPLPSYAGLGAHHHALGVAAVHQLREGAEGARRQDGALLGRSRWLSPQTTYPGEARWQEQVATRRMVNPPNGAPGPPPPSPRPASRPSGAPSLPSTHHPPTRTSPGRCCWCRPLCGRGSCCRCWRRTALTACGASPSPGWAPPAAPTPASALGRMLPPLTAGCLA
jgi:hypothetical protein